MQGRTFLLPFLFLASSALSAGACGPSEEEPYVPGTVTMPAGATAGTGGAAAGGAAAGGAAVGGMVAGGAAAGGTASGGAAAGLAGGGVSGGAAAGLTGGGAAGGMLSGGATAGMGAGIAGTGGTGGSTGGAVAGTGGTGGGVAGGGTFPRMDEAVNVEMMGPYQTEKYTMGLEDPVYQNGLIYYPKDAKPPFAAVSFSLGFIESREQLEWWGPVLASHGIVSFHNDPTSILDVPALRAEDIAAQINKLISENARAGSPLQGKLDLKRLGVMGHSMGGGGTLIAGNKLGSMVQALVPLQPWSNPLFDGEGSITSFPNITAPTLILGAQSDLVASVADHAVPFYESIKITKAYAEVKGADHMIGTTSGSAAVRGLQARLALAWLKIYLEDDKRYEEYIYGAKASEVMSQLSVWKTAKN